MFKKVVVIGVGTMGHSIAKEFAQNGYETHLVGRRKETLDQALLKIGDITNVKPHLSLGEIPKDVDLVIESVAEDLEAKHKIFKELEEICSEKTVLASNSSSFTPTQIAEVLKKKDRYLNIHYFNPPHVAKLVEVVKCAETDEKLVTYIIEFYKKLGKTPVLLNKEFPAFVANRLQAAMLREALYIVHNGVTTPEGVDDVMKFLARRWSACGLFGVCDLGGLDIFAAISKVVLPHLDDSHVPSPLLLEKVEKGEFGAKTGKGMYTWSTEKANEARALIIENLKK